MTKPGPGKFEFNYSLEESEILYEHSLDGSHPELGESEFFGWYVFIDTTEFKEEEKIHIRYNYYICYEDSQGFFHVAYGYEKEQPARNNWKQFERDWVEYANLN